MEYFGRIGEHLEITAINSLNQLNALVQFTLSAVKNNVKATDTAKDNFFATSYNEANMMVMVIGDKIISNYIHNKLN